jgi:hypothetical protein
MHVTRHYHISSKSLFEKLGIFDIEHYYHCRLLRWGGHVARMDISRLPRKFLTSWIDDQPRPPGHPFNSWTSTLAKALDSKEFEKQFDSNNVSEWTDLAQDRVGWLKAVNK